MQVSISNISRLFLASLFFANTLIASALIAVRAQANADCENQFVRVSEQVESRFLYSHARAEGRAVYFEHLPAKRGKPTLFLLNGMFVPATDLKAFRDAFEQKSKGEGLLIMFYSTQLESLYLRGLLGDDPALNLKLRDGQSLTRSDLATEAVAVLKASGAKGSIFPAGYSFGSGPVVEFASLMANQSANQPLPGVRIKEVVLLSPFVHASEQVPFGASNVESLMRLNPFLGEAAIQKMRAQSARTTAAASIDDFILKTGGLPDGVSRETAVQGVASQIMSVMDFDLRNVTGLSVPVRFVLAQNEATLRLVAQKDAMQAMKKTSDQPVELTIVPDVHHHLLAHQPEVGADALLTVLRGR